MQDETKHDKLSQPDEEGDEVEAHKYEPDEAKRDKYETLEDDGEDAEAPKV
jgi:hypothetical protein